MSDETSWVKDNLAKLSPALTKKILETCRPQKWAPRVLHKPWRSLQNAVRRLPVIIQLNTEHWVMALNTDNLGGTLGCSIQQRLEFVDGFSTSVSLNNLRQLTQHEAVKMVWLDREVKALLDIASPVIKAPQVWNIGTKGKGVGIAILDTGIYPHPDLISPTNRIAAFKDFVNNRTEPYDDNGHGTHCAGDAAGNGLKSGNKYRGPAPAAKLIGIKVLNRRGSGKISDVMAGIQWCIKNKSRYGIRVLSMSLGGTATVGARKDPICQAVEKAWRAGIVVCAAAGNEGPNPGTISTPGIDPLVITVGAIDDKNTKTTADDAVAVFSSRGPTKDGLTKPDLVAPGANIVSLRSPYSYLDKSNRQMRVGNWYMSLSGTSMATPICAGVVALVLEAHPAMTPDEVKKLLTSRCRPINGNHNVEGYGLIDALAAAGH